MAYHAVYPRHDRRITCLAGIGADGRGVRAIRSCGGTAARVRWRAVCARCVCVCVWVCVAASVCVLSSIVLRARAACACVRSRGVGGEAVERGAVCYWAEHGGSDRGHARIGQWGLCHQPGKRLSFAGRAALARAHSAGGQPRAPRLASGVDRFRRIYGRGSGSGRVARSSRSPFPCERSRKGLSRARTYEPFFPIGPCLLSQTRARESPPVAPLHAGPRSARAVRSRGRPADNVSAHLNFSETC